MSFSSQITQINTDWEKTLLGDGSCKAVFINKSSSPMKAFIGGNTFFIGGERLSHRWTEIPSLNYLIIIVIEAEWEAYSGA